MALITIPAARGENKYSYQSEYLKWRGYYDDVPVLRSVINAVADATTASWLTKGGKGTQAATMFDSIEGNGKETFKMLMTNAIKVGMICGDAYFEIVTNGDLMLENLVMLPSDNIRLVIDNGTVKRYEEIDGKAKWKPQEIFHYTNNPIGAMVHGMSDIQPLQNLLIDLKQVQDDMANIYHLYSAPIEDIAIDSDNAEEQSEFETKYRQMRHINPKQIFRPKNSVEIDYVGLPAGSVLDPAIWHRIIIEQMLSSFRVPDLALGTGTVNSEESARMKFSGFRQLVRMKQQLLEDHIERQLLSKMYPTDTPKIEFSFAAEPQEERFNRMMNAFSMVNASVLNPEIKGLLMVVILQEAGLVPKELEI